MTWILLVVASITPDGTAIKWKNGQGYAVSAGAPLTVQTSDAKTMLLIVRAAKGKHAAALTLVRDERFKSENHLRLKSVAMSPPDKTVGAMLAVVPPSGAHTYVLSSDDDVLVTVVEVPKANAPKAAAEKEIPAPVPAPVVVAPAPVAAPTSEPASMPVKAESIRARLKPLRVAVYDLELQNVPQNVGTVVTGSTLTEVRKLQRISAIGMNEVRDMLSHEATKQMLGCKESDSCLADIAGAVGVDNLVTGKLSRVEGTSVLTLRRIDQARAEVKATVEKHLKAGSGEEFLAAIGPAVAELFPEYPIREGLRRGVDKDVALRLNPPPLPIWTFGTVAGLAGAAAITGGVFGFLATSALTDYKNYANQGTQPGVVINGATLVSKGNVATQRATIANALFITSGGLVVVAAVMALFTDWHDYHHAVPPQ